MGYPSLATISLESVDSKPTSEVDTQILLSIIQDIESAAEGPNGDLYRTSDLDISMDFEGTAVDAETIVESMQPVAEKHNCTIRIDHHDDLPGEEATTHYVGPDANAERARDALQQLEEALQQLTTLTSSGTGTVPLAQIISHTKLDEKAIHTLIQTYPAQN